MSVSQVVVSVYLDKFVPELLVRLVGRQVQPVEAGVGPGVVSGAAPLLDGEQLGAVRPVQLLGTGGEASLQCTY